MSLQKKRMKKISGNERTIGDSDFILVNFELIIILLNNKPFLEEVPKGNQTSTAHI